jgi:hypothetical protein
MHRKHAKSEDELEFLDELTHPRQLYVIRQ